MASGRHWLSASEPARRMAGVRTDQGPARPDPAARRLHRRRGDGRGHLRVLPRAGHQAAPALWPDRKQRLQRHPGARRGAACTPSAVRCRASMSGSATMARSWCGRAACSAATSSRTTPRGRRCDDGWLHTGDAGYLEADGHLVVLGRLSDVVHTAKRRALHSELHREPAQVQPLRQGRRRARAGPRDVGGDHLHRPGSGRPVGRAARHLLHLLCRPVAEAGSDRPGRRRGTGTSTARCRTGCGCGRFVCLHKEFDADDGEITRTRKIRRNVVEERYRPIIDAIYDRQTTVLMKARDQLRERRGRRHRAHALGTGGLTHGLGAAARIRRQRRAASA